MIFPKKFFSAREGNRSDGLQAEGNAADFPCDFQDSAVVSRLFDHPADDGGGGTDKFAVIGTDHYDSRNAVAVAQNLNVPPGGEAEFP